MKLAADISPRTQARLTRSAPGDRSHPPRNSPSRGADFNFEQIAFPRDSGGRFVVGRISRRTCQS